MTDEQLAKFLGIDREPCGLQWVAKLSPEKRATYVKLAETCHAVELYDQGLGPKPEGVIVCHDHKSKRKRGGGGGIRRTKPRRTSSRWR